MSSDTMVQANMNLNININIDINDIIKSCQQPGRAETVQSVLWTLDSQLQQQRKGHLNILILNLSQAQRCNKAFAESYWFGNFHWTQGFDACTFGVWIFSTGWIDHTHEDGGYINWAFTGGKRSGEGGGYVEWK
ncbi:hypothetical protein B0T14DRAFT_526772 [Immersiella caudata]|uniref:Uncharacterized protein n=1 Tax=Immersiella caudata TaxID=314043 RepID=A0AA40BU35_9PEZI|nr:hypothetical protein B0T14DRAFT_526772 [Immersiella caudata]